MLHPTTTGAKSADVLFFYAENGTVLIAGLCSMFVEPSSSLLLAFPLIAIGLGRMLLFHLRMKSGKVNSVFQWYDRPTQRQTVVPTRPNRLSRTEAAANGR